MYVAELWRYPVKSMRGELLQHAELLKTGIRGDREIVVLSSARQRVITSRTHHRLLGLQGGILTDTEKATVNGFPWDSPEAVALAEQAAGETRRIDSGSRHRTLRCVASPGCDRRSHRRNRSGSAPFSPQHRHRRSRGPHRAPVGREANSPRRGRNSRRAITCALRHDHLRSRHPGAGPLSAVPYRLRLRRNHGTGLFGDNARYDFCRRSGYRLGLEKVREFDLKGHGFSRAASGQLKTGL